MKESLILLLELGLESVEIGHLRVPGAPHAVDEALDIGDSHPSVRDAFGDPLDHRLAVLRISRQGFLLGSEGDHLLGLSLEDRGWRMEDRGWRMEDRG